MNIIQRRMMGWMFIICFVISVIIGIAAGKSGTIISVIICVLGGFLSLILGMAIGAVRFHGDAERARLAAIGDQRIAINAARIKEDLYKKMVIRAKENAKMECAGFALETARVVANKVANRLIARHAGRLMELEYREATLQETDAIVNEELKAFEDSVVGK